MWSFRGQITTSMLRGSWSYADASSGIPPSVASLWKHSENFKLLCVKVKTGVCHSGGFPLQDSLFSCSPQEVKPCMQILSFGLMRPWARFVGKFLPVLVRLTERSHGQERVLYMSSFITFNQYITHFYTQACHWFFHFDRTNQFIQISQGTETICSFSDHMSTVTSAEVFCSSAGVCVWQNSQTEA